MKIYPHKNLYTHCVLMSFFFFWCWYGYLRYYYHWGYMNCNYLGRLAEVCMGFSCTIFTTFFCICNDSKNTKKRKQRGNTHTRALTCTHTQACTHSIRYSAFSGIQSIRWNESISKTSQKHYIDALCLIGYKVREGRLKPKEVKWWLAPWEQYYGEFHGSTVT